MESLNYASVLYTIEGLFLTINAN